MNERTELMDNLVILWVLLGELIFAISAVFWWDNTRIKSVLKRTISSVKDKILCFPYLLYLNQIKEFMNEADLPL